MCRGQFVKAWTKIHDLKEYARKLVIQQAVDHYAIQFNENTGNSFKFKSYDSWLLLVAKVSKIHPYRRHNYVIIMCTFT